MRETSLPRSDWQPSCELLVFPLARRIGKIRRCAEVLESRNGNEAAGYWKHQMRLLATSLERTGCDPLEIDRQLGDFQEAVQSELERRACERP